MPSTFSPNLRIELIGAGEQAGTWGTTTNTNLGTLVEDAISGYVAVTISSTNQALTTVNGAADQARNAMVQLNSASAPFAVYAPPESKQYVVFNNTAHVATIFNSTVVGNTTPAGAGIAIPAGRTVSVWSDGTNFRVQNNLIIGDVVGNVTGNVTGNLNGNLTAAAPTAATQATSTNNTSIATTAFVQAIKASLHPVGSIYINATDATNPATLLGFGTWAAFGAGRVPVGFNAADPLFDTAEKIGGSKDTTLPSHTHGISGSGTTGNQSADHNHGFSATTAGQSANHNHAISISDPGHRHDSSIPINDATTAPYGVTNNVNSRELTIIADSANSWFTSTETTGITASSGNNSADHNHGVSGTTGNNSVAHNHSFAFSGTSAAAGASPTNTNLQPYITVFMWKRTA